MLILDIVEELKKILEKKVKHFISVVKNKLMKEYELSESEAKAALNGWDVKWFLDASMNLGKYRQVRQMLHLGRFPDLEEIYGDYIYHQNTVLGMDLKEKRRNFYALP